MDAKAARTRHFAFALTGTLMLCASACAHKGDASPQSGGHGDRAGTRAERAPRATAQLGTAAGEAEGYAKARPAAPHEVDHAYEEQHVDPYDDDLRDRTLGTSYGERLESHVVETAFTRRSPHQPAAMLAIDYDDAVGAFAPYPAWSPEVLTTEATFRTGALEVTLVDERDHPLAAASHSGRTVAVGGIDQRYEIIVHNAGATRYEVVVSVDGLDVIDGTDASYEHDGYVLEPYGTVHIDGWRTSYQSVAAFRFSDVPDSYGARTGRPHNVGVVGVAFFDEQPQRPAPRPYAHRPWAPKPDPEPFPGNR